MKTVNINSKIFGYIGIGLVLLSMMASVERQLNAAGSAVTGLYAAISGTWLVVWLNVGILLINAYHLIRLKKQADERRKLNETDY